MEITLNAYEYYSYSWIYLKCATVEKVILKIHYNTTEMK